jgi:hypothetical protein
MADPSFLEMLPNLRNEKAREKGNEVSEVQSFDFEDAFDEYMRKVAPSVPEHAVQYRECRRAFIAGARRIYVHMTQGVVQLSDADAEKELRRLDKEMRVYWERACEEKD